MKKEKSVLHLCEGTLLALVILLIMDLYLLKFRIRKYPTIPYFILWKQLWHFWL